MDTARETEAFELFKSGDFAGARRLFQELCDGATSDLQRNRQRHNLASCLTAQGNQEEALAKLDGLEQAVYGDALIYSKAICHIKLADFDAALSCLGKLTLMSLEPGEQLGHEILELLAVCANSSHLWRNHHTNCMQIESLLARLHDYMLGDQLERRQRWQWHWLWRKNMAHVVFMMDTRYEDCVQMYSELLDEWQQNRTPPPPPTSRAEDNEGPSFEDVDPVLLRNLCVSYILTGCTREAEQLIKEIEFEEKAPSGADDLELATSLCSTTDENNFALAQESRPASHLEQVNLAVGTLYCVKNNYDFGLGRIMDTLEPVEKKLTTFTWSQAKRCILSMLDKHCRQLIYIEDDLLERLVEFLTQCERAGLLILTNPQGSSEGRNSVTYEARQLRAILLNVIHD